MSKVSWSLLFLSLLFSDLEARINLLDNEASNTNQQKVIIPEHADSSELDQRSLFDKTRRGVVAITTTAHLLIDRGNSSAV